MNAASPLLLIPSVWAALAVLVAGLAWAQGRWTIAPEWSRKAVHVGMGLVCAAFPWLFSEFWQVAVTVAGATGLLLAIRLVPALQVRFGSVLGGVGRASLGDVFFPVSVLLLFALAGREPVLYVVPMLLLTLADAAAALVGTSWGRRSFTADEGFKTWEGSLAFLVVAFLCAWLPLLLAAPELGARTALVALCIALVTMLLEASAWRGLDNLFVPLAALVMLRLYVPMSVVDLCERLAVLAGLFVVFLATRRHALMREGTLLGAALAVYLCWVIGGWQWVVAPLTLWLLHPLLIDGGTRGEDLPVHSHPALLGLALPPLAWLFAAHFTKQPKLFGAFTLALAAHLAMTAVSLRRTDRLPRGLCRATGFGVLCGWLAFMPFGLMTGASASLNAGVLAATLAAIAFHLLLPRLAATVPHWTCRAALATAASLLLAFWKGPL
jgi:phytol kinase